MQIKIPTNSTTEFLKKYLIDKISAGIISNKEFTRIMSSNKALWSLLLTSEHRVEFYNELEKMGISPTKEELSEHSYEVKLNAWYALACFNCSSIFESLFSKGIFPSSADLSVCFPDTEVNAWHWLAGLKGNISALNTLIEKNILPSNASLSIRNPESNSNAWYWLANGKERPLIFKALLDKNIIPSADDLSFCNSESKINTWYLLSVQDNTLFKDLLDKNVYPTSADLNVCFQDKKNTWFWLVEKRQILILQLLYDYGIFPNKEIETVQYNTDLRIIINKLNVSRITFGKIYDNLKISENHCITRLLARDEDEVNSFYGFLYLLLLSLSKNFEGKSRELFLPFDTWYQIGNYLLPKFMNSEKLKNFISDADQSRTLFVKSHVIKSLTDYCKPLYIFWNKKYYDRAYALQKAIIEDPDRPQKLLSNQYFMSKNPGKTLYKKPSSEYQKHFTEKNDDQKFSDILIAGIKLSV